MIISFLIISIGIIPIVLAISILKIYKGSELSYALLFYMLSISFWQIDIAVLYLKGILSEELILWLFKFFRAGPTFMIPLVFYLSYVTVKKHSAYIKDNQFYRPLVSIFTRKVLVLLVVWSTFVFIVNLTDYGVSGLREVQITNTNNTFYFPEYGRLHSLYVFHTASFLIFIAFSYFVSKFIQNIYLKGFLGTFSLCSFLLYLSGFLNFVPGAGALYSSLGVIIFSVIIIFSFVKMNTMMTINYNRLLERQKKLDYTGNLTASLVHEVKNSLQIIKGYSKLMSELTPLPEQGKNMNEMIQIAADQLHDLTVNYTEYIKYKSIEFKMFDLNEIIDQAIELSIESLKENSVEISFEKKYKTLKAYVNHTYMKQVFVNLIKNSLEAIPQERKIRRIALSTQVEGDKIIIDIVDTGTGVPLENWDAIFDPFISFKKEGLGLGLPFIKKIIFEHRGNIKIVDSSSHGTHFQIILPQYVFSDFYTH
ncbi:sensor histidine kinase [Peribacillus sp. JNUCC 23]